MTNRNGGALETTEFQDMLTHDGMFVVDAEQRIVHWNESAERILGFRASEVEGRMCYELVGGKDSRNYRVCRRACPVVTNARRGRPTPDYDLLCVGASGEERWINMSVAIPRRKKGEVQVVHLFRDVSSRHRTEEFAQKAATALRDLLNKAEVQEEERETNTVPMPKLSRREMEVLRLLSTGQTTKQIASTLAIQPITARNHITRLLTKLGVESRLQAVVYASERRLI